MPKILRVGFIFILNYFMEQFYVGDYVKMKMKIHNVEVIYEIKEIFVSNRFGAYIPFATISPIHDYKTDMGLITSDNKRTSKIDELLLVKNNIH